MRGSLPGNPKSSKSLLYALIAEVPDADSPHFRRLFAEFELSVLKRRPRVAAYGGAKQWRLVRDGDGYAVGAADTETSLIEQYRELQDVDLMAFDEQAHADRMSEWHTIEMRCLDQSARESRDGRACYTHQ